MKILHVPYSYFPNPVGGTEVYVSALIRALDKQGVHCAVAAPGDVDEAYVHEGTEVRRFKPGPIVEDPIDLYSLEDAEGATRFDSILEHLQPDLVHLHALTRTVGLSLLAAVRNRRIPVVFSYHTPTVTCQRGTLLRWGNEICDGEIRVRTCSACTLHAKGVARPLSRLLAGSPSSLGRASVHLPGDLGTAAGMTYLTRARREATTSFLTSVDHIIAMATWTLGVLEINGVPPNKVTLSPHGIESPSEHAGRTTATRALRLAWLSRVVPEKGLLSILETLRQIPDAPIQVDVFPVSQNEEAEAQIASVRSEASTDKRISFQEPIPSGQVVRQLRDYDAVLTTPLSLETGPLVVLEAHAAGLPVIGPRLGGVAEKVREGKDGFLVDPFDPDALPDLLSELADEPDRVRRMRNKVAVPRSMTDVASEMVAVYESVGVNP